MSEPASQPETSFRLPTDEMAFVALVQRELRGQLLPHEQQALNDGGPEVLIRWLAVLDRFAADLDSQFLERRQDMDRALQKKANRSAWAQRKEAYHKWRKGARRFKSQVVHRVSMIRSRLDLAALDEIRALRALLAEGAQLELTDDAFQLWRDRAQAELSRSGLEEQGVVDLEARRQKSPHARHSARASATMDT